jgi:HlyD family secretion protein
MKRKLLLILLITAAVAAVVYFAIVSHRHEIVLTGIVTTDEVVVSAEIQGRLQQLLVRQGDRVTNGQLIAVIQPAERKADLAFYTNSAQQSSAQVSEAEADLGFQEAQSSNLIWQSEANLGATKDQVVQAQADLENAELTFKREQNLNKQGVNSASEFDQARTAYDAAKARVESLRTKPWRRRRRWPWPNRPAARLPPVARRWRPARISTRRRPPRPSGRRCNWITPKFAPRLTASLMSAPPCKGEVVNPGQGIVTLINPGQFWVRADVEETYIDSIHLATSCRCGCPPARSGRERSFIAASTPITRRNGT